MLLVAVNRAGHVVAEIETVKPLTVRFVVLETEEGNVPHVADFARAVRQAHAEVRAEIAALGDFVAVAVFVVFAGDVARESIAPVGPPEAGAVVGIKGQDLFRQAFSLVSLHGEIAVEHVVLLGGVLEEIAVADGLVTDVVAHHEEVGAVNREPAIVRIPNARAGHAAAAHRVAHEMKVNRVFAEHALFAEMTELGVTDAAGAVAMKHRVAAHAGGIG